MEGLVQPAAALSACCLWCSFIFKGAAKAWPQTFPSEAINVLIVVLCG